VGRPRNALTTEEKAAVEDLVDEIARYQDGEILLSRGDLCDRSTIFGQISREAR
jgi:hypothetical protein